MTASVPAETDSQRLVVEPALAREVESAAGAAPPRPRPPRGAARAGGTSSSASSSRWPRTPPTRRTPPGRRRTRSRRVPDRPGHPMVRRSAGPRSVATAEMLREERCDVSHAAELLAATAAALFTKGIPRSGLGSSGPESPAGRRLVRHSRAHRPDARRAGERRGPDGPRRTGGLSGPPFPPVERRPPTGVRRPDRRAEEADRRAVYRPQRRSHGRTLRPHRLRPVGRLLAGRMTPPESVGAPRDPGWGAPKFPGTPDPTPRPPPRSGEGVFNRTSRAKFRRGFQAPAGFPGHDSRSNTPSPFMGRGTGGGVSKTREKPNTDP